MENVSSHPIDSHEIPITLPDVIAASPPEQKRRHFPLRVLLYVGKTIDDVTRPFAQAIVDQQIPSIEDVKRSRDDLKL